MREKGKKLLTSFVLVFLMSCALLVWNGLSVQATESTATGVTISATSEKESATYGTIEAAIEAAVDGDTLVLNEDQVLPTAYEYIKKAITIDLNGHTLQAGSLATFKGKVIDSGEGTGLLKGVGNKLHIPSNEYIPVWDSANSGYRFVDVNMEGVWIGSNAEKLASFENEFIYFLMEPDFGEKVNALLGEGLGDYKLRIGVRLKWTSGAVTQVQNYVYSSEGADSMVSKVYADGIGTNVLSFSVKGVDNYENIMAVPFVVSDSGIMREVTGADVDEEILKPRTPEAKERGPILAVADALEPEINWENVRPEGYYVTSDSYVENLKDHPRILVRDWEAVTAKITAEEYSGSGLPTSNTVLPSYWYKKLKSTADTYADYNVNNPNKIYTALADYADLADVEKNDIEICRSAAKMLQTLAFVHNIEKQLGNVSENSKYLQAAYDQMLLMGGVCLGTGDCTEDECTGACGKWDLVSWDGESHILSTAEILFGYACAYDWLHDDLSAEQLANIYNVVKEKALTHYVYYYAATDADLEDAGLVNIRTVRHNWNAVCNGTAFVAAAAFADEQPKVSEFFMELAPEFLIETMLQYNPEGAYGEGVSYWDLGTTYLCYAMDIMDNAFVSGYEIDTKYDFCDETQYPGFAKTCDYPIYFTGPVRRFNYGDCNTGFSSTPVFYFMANKLEKPEYAWYENDIQLNFDGYRLADDEAISAICWYDSNNVEYKDFVRDKFYGLDENADASVTWNTTLQKWEGTAAFHGLSFRSSWERETALFAAMQGGSSANNHMHDSLGTYVIDWMGARFVTQLGMHDYNNLKNQYYTRAEAYNTVVINMPTTASEADQSSVGWAELASHGTTDAGDVFGVFDMINAYRTTTDGGETYTYVTGNAAVTSAKRGMMMSNDRSRVRVQDEIQMDVASDFYWFANIPKSSATISSDGKSALLTVKDLWGTERYMLVHIVEGPESAKLEVVPAESMLSDVRNDWITGTLYKGTTLAADKQIEKLRIVVRGQSSLDLAVDYVGLDSKPSDLENLGFTFDAFRLMETWGNTGTYTVSFMNDSSVVARKTVYEGATTSLEGVPEPKKSPDITVSDSGVSITQYTFDGWYNGDTEFSVDQVITSDVTYEANFTSTTTSYTSKVSSITTGTGLSANSGGLETGAADPLESSNAVFRLYNSSSAIDYMTQKYSVGSSWGTSYSSKTAILSFRVYTTGASEALTQFAGGDKAFWKGTATDGWKDVVVVMVPNGTGSWNTTAYEKQGTEWVNVLIDGSEVYTSAATRSGSWSNYYYNILIAGKGMTASADNVYYDDIRIFR